MKNLLIFFLLYLLLLLSIGCSSATFPSLFGNPTDPTEMHEWNPPSDKTFQFRRENQKRLDIISEHIEALFLINEDVTKEEDVILASIRNFNPKLGSMEDQIREKINMISLNFGKLEAQLAKTETSRENLKAAIIRFKNYKPPKKLSITHYLAAVELFKEGKYKKSINQFQKILKRKPPHFLMDNIHFGIGSAYYKLNKLDDAAKHFQIITEKYSTGDKWPGSYLMLGLIYNTLNQKSKAIYLIENALEKNLLEQPRQLLQHLLITIQDEDKEEEKQPDVSS